MPFPASRADVAIVLKRLNKRRADRGDGFNIVTLGDFVVLSCWLEPLEEHKSFNEGRVYVAAENWGFRDVEIAVTVASGTPEVVKVDSLAAGTLQAPCEAKLNLDFEFVEARKITSDRKCNVTFDADGQLHGSRYVRSSSFSVVTR